MCPQDKQDYFVKDKKAFCQYLNEPVYLNPAKLIRISDKSHFIVN